MSEFKEVMRQYVRMCQNNDNCDRCPIFNQYGCYNTFKRFAECNDIESLEKSVMAWAAEHPESAYPTWGEWLCENVPRFGAADSIDEAVRVLYRVNIPDDIAEKLRIEPKGEWIETGEIK